VNVLIVFHSTAGATEQLALAVGVGAIQARADIRLRRLPPAQASAPEAAPGQLRQTFQRMARDYVEPRQPDVIWADVVVLAASADGASQVESFVAQLPAFTPLDGKVAGVIVAGNSQVRERISGAAARVGLTVAPAAAALDTEEERQAYGREVVRFAEALG
jgi:hypothetical protein